MHLAVVYKSSTGRAQVKQEILALFRAQLHMVARNHRVIQNNIAGGAPANVNDGFCKSSLFFSVDNQVRVRGDGFFSNLARHSLESRLALPVIMLGVINMNPDGFWGKFEVGNDSDAQKVKKGISLL